MSVFALRPRELRHAPHAGADAGHLSRDDLSRVLIACGVALVLSVVLVFSLLMLPEAQLNGPVAAPHLVKPAWVEILEAVPAVRAERAGLGRDLTYWDRATSRRRRTPRSSDLRKIRCHRLAADHALSARHGRSRSNAILYRHGPPRRTCRTGSGSHGPAAASANPRGQLRRRGFHPREHKRRFGSEFALSWFPFDRRQILEIGGFACGTPGNPIDRARLACALDRLDLISAGEDRELRAFFTGAPRQLGAACSTPPGEAQKNEPVKTTPGFVVLR